VRNDPTNKVDVTGHCGLACVVKIVTTAVTVNDLMKGTETTKVMQKFTQGFVKRYYDKRSGDSVYDPKDHKMGLRSAIGYEDNSSGVADECILGIWCKNTKVEKYRPAGGHTTFIKNKEQLVRWQYQHERRYRFMGADGRFSKAERGRYTRSRDHAIDNVHAKANLRKSLWHINQGGGARARLDSARAAIKYARKANTQAHNGLKAMTKKIYAKAIRKFRRAASHIKGKQCTFNRRHHRVCY
jgi:hypothetical protein